LIFLTLVLVALLIVVSIRQTRRLAGVDMRMDAAAAHRAEQRA
jgi:hypothetical protein